MEAVTSMKQLKMTFMGAGSMAEAIIRGLVKENIVDAHQIYSVNRSQLTTKEQLKAKYGIHAATIAEEPDTAAQWIQQADIIVLSMKPKDVKAALLSIQQLLQPEQLIISVIAGTSIPTLHKLLRKNMPIIRTMPNTSSSIGMGVTGMCFSDEVNTDQRQLGQTIFEAIGHVSVVEESQLDIVTGLSGSGPAYVYYFIEALVQGGIQGGLAPDIARALAVQTVRGAAAMVEFTGEEPAELRRKVTSPNGTTQAAIEFMQQHQLFEIVSRAVLRSKERSMEISQQMDSD